MLDLVIIIGRMIDIPKHRRVFTTDNSAMAEILHGFHHAIVDFTVDIKQGLDSFSQDLCCKCGKDFPNNVNSQTDLDLGVSNPSIVIV